MLKLLSKAEDELDGEAGLKINEAYPKSNLKRWSTTKSSTHIDRSIPSSFDKRLAEIERKTRSTLPCIMPASTTSIVPSDLHQSFLFFLQTGLVFWNFSLGLDLNSSLFWLHMFFSFRMTGKKTKSPTYVSNPEEIFRCLGATFDQVVLFLSGIVRLFPMIQKHPLKVLNFIGYF